MNKGAAMLAERLLEGLAVGGIKNLRRRLF